VTTRISQLALLRFALLHEKHVAQGLKHIRVVSPCICIMNNDEVVEKEPCPSCGNEIVSDLMNIFNFLGFFNKTS
jgi:hypothetical protein